MVPSTIRKALGTVKDQTSISIAKVSSNITPELDVAIVKATGHDEDPAEERHIREILNLTTYSRGNVSDCVVALSRRLRKTRNWIVALKALMLVHRLLTKGNPYFQVEMFYFTHKGIHLLNMSDFHDEAHSSSSDHSAFVRAYALYLDQSLQLMFSEDKQHGNGDRYEDGYYYNKSPENKYNKRSPGQTSEEKKTQTPLKDMKTEKVLHKMFQLQQILDCVLELRPTGDAKYSRLIVIALYPIARDSFQLNADLFEILTELQYRFFEMEYADCVKYFNAYASAAKQIDELVCFYSWCKDVGVAKFSEFPEVQRINVKWLDALEVFMRDRARKSVDLPKAPEPVSEPISTIKAPPEETVPKVKKYEEVNLLDLSEDDVPAVDHGNELALTLFSDDAISASKGSWDPFSCADGDGQSRVTDKMTSDWELALVESASILSKEKENSPNGFNPFVFNGMYDQGTVNQHIHMSDVENKQEMLMQEQVMWQQYGQNAMQGQTNIGRADNGCMYPNARMEHSGMPPPSNGSSGFYFPPPF